jgi:ABC-2 type transport system ATP-binding protein
MQGTVSTTSLSIGPDGAIICAFRLAWDEARVASTPAILRFQQVSKSFGGTRALQAVNFELEAGRFHGLAGLNGAGKTTLLKCMLDFCALDQGHIELCGMAHNNPRARARVAYMPERFNPPYYFKGGEFIRYMLSLQSCAYRQTEVEAMFEALDLDPAALHKPVREYSKGMNQKLGLAACFLSQRDFYVLDEPMSGLDPRARACLKAVLDDLKTKGATVLFTSHALTDIAEVCDQMLVLHQGVSYYAGPPRSLCDHYATNSLEDAFLSLIEKAPAHEH